MNINDLKTKALSHKKVLSALVSILMVLVLGNAIYHIVHKPTIVKDVPVVRTMTLGDSSASSIYTYPGEVRGKYESNLAFQVAGKIVSRSVQLGDTVEAGQVLLTIDPKDVQQSVNVSQAAVNSAQANYKLTKDMYSRYQTLYKQGAVSQAIRDQYETQYQAAEATLAQATAQLTASQNQLNYTKLTADHAGVVSALTGEVGQVVAAGSPVVTVVQGGNREVQIFVPEGRLNTIAPNQSATVTFWALNNITAQGHIAEIAPMADATTKTYKVRVAIEAMPASARLGMTAKVSLDEGAQSYILLPRSSIYQTAATPSVWVVKDNKVSLVSIKTDGYKDDKVVVTDGLKKGDVIVVGGISKLSEGMVVKLEGGVNS